MTNQMGLCRFAFYSAGTLPGTEFTATETRLDIRRGDGLGTTHNRASLTAGSQLGHFQKTGLHPTLMTRWAILRKQ
jgi:hypothetical protein